MRCAHCDFENEADASFCEVCGGSLGERPAAGGTAVLQSRTTSLGTGEPTTLARSQTQRAEAAISGVPLSLLEVRPLPKRSAGNPKRLYLVSHWSTFVDGLKVSPSDFYVRVQLAIEARQLPGTALAKVEWSEGGVFSAKREYLRIERKELIFDICGAPFGRGFFVSWWLAAYPSGCLVLLMSFIPFAADIFFRHVRPNTYYQRDTASMFQTAVHSAVMEVVDQLTQAKGIRGLSELERKPIMRDFFKG